MSASYSNIQPQQTRKGLAITSLVLGIISIPTLGLLGVGAITAIVLGAISLKSARKEPAIYGGKGMAVAGIVTSVVSLLLCSVAAIAVPKPNESFVRSRESGAIQTLRTFHITEMHFDAKNSRFATLKELAEAGLIDSNYASEKAISGYIYSSSGVTVKTY